MSRQIYEQKDREGLERQRKEHHDWEERRMEQNDWDSQRKICLFVC